MDLEYAERYETFRKEVRAFLDEHKDDRPKASFSEAEPSAVSDWLSLQIEHGYWARTIPKEYGGYGAEPDLLETVIMDEEFNRAHVTRGFAAQGPAMLVPTLAGIRPIYAVLRDRSAAAPVPGEATGPAR